MGNCQSNRLRSVRSEENIAKFIMTIINPFGNVLNNFACRIKQFTSFYGGSLA